MELSLTAINEAILLPIYHLAALNAFTQWVAALFALWLPYAAGIFVVAYIFVVEDEDRTVVQMMKRLIIPVLVGWGSVMIAKHLFAMPRPFVGDLGVTPLVPVLDPFGSFPSAHAAFFAALLAAMIVLRFPFIRAYAIIMVVVSLGRVAAGVHWPSDVVVGMIWGFAVGGIVAFLIHPRKQKIAQS